MYYSNAFETGGKHIWEHIGNDRRSLVVDRLDPETFAYNYNYFRSIIGKEFDLNMMLEVEKILSIAMLVEAIGNLPEYLEYYFKDYKGGSNNHASDGD